MRKLYIFGLVGLVVAVSSLAEAEELTMTTYYPAPFGVYKEIRAKRMAIGDAYYDASQYDWEEVHTNIDSKVDLIIEGKVGIGTTHPTNDVLQVEKDQVAFTRIGIDNPNSNGGTGLSFYEGTARKATVEYSNFLDRFLIGTLQAVSMVFVTDNTARMRITSDGNVEVDGNVKELGPLGYYDLVPEGAILMFRRPDDRCPDGWTPVDELNVGRFPLGHTIEQGPFTNLNASSSDGWTSGALGHPADDGFRFDGSGLATYYKHGHKVPYYHVTFCRKDF